MSFPVARTLKSDVKNQHKHVQCFRVSSLTDKSNEIFNIPGKFPEEKFIFHKITNKCLLVFGKEQVRFYWAFKD